MAAAAYNAGPRRITDWVARRGGLPGETRNYVVRITGRQAEQWTSKEFARGPEAALMPAKAPCAEVAQAVEAQAKVVRAFKLMSELAAATKAPPRDNPNDKFDEAGWTIASAKPEWQKHALSVVRGALQDISEHKAREASAKAAQAWSRIADRTMKKAAEEFANASVEKSEKAQKPAAAASRGPLRKVRVAASR